MAAAWTLEKACTTSLSIAGGVLDNRDAAADLRDRLQHQLSASELL